VTITHIPAVPDAATATARFWAQLRSLDRVSEHLPSDADLTGRVVLDRLADWITTHRGAPGRSPTRA
jgi:hypothetical protein